MDLERRIITADLELRADSDGDAARPAFEGYASVFNQPSVDMGFIETVDPAAFTRTLAAGPDVLANVQHEGGLATIGRTRNGTLNLETDDVGLRVRITPPDTQAGRDALELVRGGFVNQMSFAFRVVREAWTKGGDGTPRRRLLDVELDGGDVAIVTGPAYPQTTVEVRAMAASLTEDGSAADKTQADEGASSEDRLANRKRKIDILRRL
jgi:HK97 family phage prohead protease